MAAPREGMVLLRLEQPQVHRCSRDPPGHVSGLPVLGTNRGVMSAIKRRGYLALVLMGGFLLGGVLIELANESFFSKPRT